MNKISRSSQFDLKLCARGLSVLLSCMHSEIYEYAYYLTFKRSMKQYAGQFNDPWEQLIEDYEFFKNTGDPYVVNCFQTVTKIMECQMTIVTRYGIDDVADLRDEIIHAESDRFKPYYLIYKHSKSYKRLRLFYDRFLAESIKSLYTYCCVFTSGKYRVPLALKRQFNFADADSFRLLNEEDNNVALLMELIIQLKKDLNDLRFIAISKIVTTRVRKSSQPVI